METALSSFRYRDSVFKIDILGSDIWRWTIVPRHEGDLTLIGQFAGPRERAISYCRAEIDRVLGGIQDQDAKSGTHAAALEP